MATIPYVLVDAFTSEPFAGNPAAVCLLTEPLPHIAIASEFNLSETAFVRAIDEGLLRWFTPKDEVALRACQPPPTLYNEHLAALELPVSNAERRATWHQKVTFRIKLPATPPTEARRPCPHSGTWNQNAITRSIFDLMASYRARKTSPH